MALNWVKELTDGYLRPHLGIGVPPSPETDFLLRPLLSHCPEEPTGDIVFVACLHALSISVAYEHLEWFREGDAARYVRLLTLASEAHPNIVPLSIRDQIRNLSRLVSFESGAQQDLGYFQAVVKCVGDGAVWEHMPLELIQQLLLDSGCSTRIQNHIQSLLGEHRYLSAFKALAWLKSVNELPNGQAACTLLDNVIPFWNSLRIWEPTIFRVAQFELKGFSEAQRQKLTYLLALEGPDTSTNQKSSLAKVDLCDRQSHSCYLSTSQAEYMLKLLLKCQRLGPCFVDLFTYLCLEPQFEEFGPSFVDHILCTGEESNALSAYRLLVAVRDNMKIDRQMEELTKSMHVLNAVHIQWLDRAPMLQVVLSIEDIMRAAQDSFCTALTSGTGKKFGHRIRELGTAILTTRAIHPQLSDDFLIFLRNMPSKDTLDVAFRRILEISQRSHMSTAQSCKFKSYLAFALARRPINLHDSITPAAIQRELEFWKHPPDTTRRDLAEALARVDAVPYSLYTSWLLVILRESDQFIDDIKNILSNGEEGVLALANFLATRRRFNQMRDKTWLLLFASLIRDRGPIYLTASRPAQEWPDLISNLSKLIVDTQGHMPQFRAGFTEEQLGWWDSLNRRQRFVKLLVGDGNRVADLTWLYFPQHPERLETLLRTLADLEAQDSIHHQVLRFLSPDGSNISVICECVETLTTASDLGKTVFERQLARHEGKVARQLPHDVPGVLATLFESWRDYRSPLNHAEKQSLSLLQVLLERPQSAPALALSAAKAHLHAEYKDLIERGKGLEQSRTALHQANPHRLATLLNLLQVPNSHPGREHGDMVPEEIADAVEVIGGNEFELAFPLTGMNEVQRAGKGISKDARLLLVRIKVTADAVRFCAHFWSQQEDTGRARHWEDPNRRACNTPPNLFIYYLTRQLSLTLDHRTLQNLSMAQNTVSTLVSTAASKCLMCSGNMDLRRWKPATCSINCSRALVFAPLEVRLHNLLIDAKAIDLLLTSIYATAAEPNGRRFLPNCPVVLGRIQAILDSMPSMENLQTAKDLQSAIRTGSALGEDREKLLSWLCLRFRGFILSAPTDWRIPSLGTNTHQFVLLNPSPENERAFSARYAAGGGSTVVFHGTRASRLFPILGNGLRVATGPDQLNGAAYGEGIYCGHDPQTSWTFAKSTGNSWRNSTLKNLNVLLGCELTPANHPTHGTIYVVRDEDRILVRYVLLLPQSSQVPARNHVEPGITSGIAKLRSGLS